jgi:ribonuclease VapC
LIVDSSALVAILLLEPEAKAFTRALAASTYKGLSAASFVETAVVIDSRRDPVASRQLDNLVARSNILIEPFTAEQAAVARQAYRDFGRGSGHPAKLNFGDCMSYALAKVRDEPLLFKGDDFGHTDITSALPVPS